MDLFNLISNHEKDMIEAYIGRYATPEDNYPSEYHRAPLSVVLKPWKDAKEEFLGEVFDGQLIYSQDVTYYTPFDELYENVCRSNVVYKFRSIFNRWATAFARKSNDTFELEGHLRTLTDELTLTKNVYESDSFEIPDPSRPGKMLKINNGCKPVRIIGKICNLYNVGTAEQFEEFRIEMSRVLNVAKLRGKLCISIHPLDYMTMSDNSSGWDSCMSWTNVGSFRQGTVEMMNGNYVVVAYLAAAHPSYFDADVVWNNKKWRSLYICSPWFIGNIKGYPYQVPELDKKVIEILAGMVEKANPSIKYNPVCEYKYNKSKETLGVSVRFSTGYMYNDFGTLDKNYGCVNSACEEAHLNIRYSGDSECMWCGRTNVSYDCEELLICDNCSPHLHCEECGCNFSEDELFSTADGRLVCESCLNEYYRPEFGTEDYYNINNLESIFVLPDNFKEAIETKAFDILSLRSANYPAIRLTNYTNNWHKGQIEDFSEDFLNENEVIYLKRRVKLWCTDIVPYVFVSQLQKDTKDIIDSMCEDEFGLSFYEFWTNTKYRPVWSNYLAAEEYTEGLDEKKLS